VHVTTSIKGNQSIASVKSMRVHVKFEDKCLVIPCKDGKQSIKWLISEAVERFRKLRSTESTVSSQLDDDLSNNCLYLPGGGMLFFNDAIEDVLENDGFAELKSKIENEGLCI
jgi:hypothetical protein